MKIEGELQCFYVRFVLFQFNFIKILKQMWKIEFREFTDDYENLKTRKKNENPKLFCFNFVIFFLQRSSVLGRIQCAHGHNEAIGENANERINDAIGYFIQKFNKFPAISLF